MFGFKAFLSESAEQEAYHGSPHPSIHKDGFNTHEVFLAKHPNEAKRYGKHLYKVKFKGSPRFETPTIFVIHKDSVTDIKSHK